MVDQRQHRILLANFAEADAERIRRAGYNAECGYVGPARLRPATEKLRIPCKIPHPFYDYDVYVYSSETLEGEPAETSDLMVDERIYEPLQSFGGPPLVRVAFVGRSASAKLEPAGIPLVHLVSANDNVSQFCITDCEETFSIPRLHQCLAELRPDINLPIYQYAEIHARDIWPFRHFPVVVNRNGDQIIAYGVRVPGGEGIPVYIVLPQFRDNVAALEAVLDTLRGVSPELFVGYTGRGWLSSPEFLLPEEIAIDREIDAKKQEVTDFIAQKSIERAQIAEKWAFMRGVLTASESKGLEPHERLAAQVRRILEFIGFKVTDVDQEIKSAIRKEDFWVEDPEEGFFAITEVTGTVNKNPKIKEYNDLLGRMNVIFRRSDLVPAVKKERMSGLLIVNHDMESHPNERPPLYTGAQEEIAQGAIDARIGILSTVVLYRIGMAAKTGQITKAVARQAIKSLGRIEFNVKAEPASSSS